MTQREKLFQNVKSNYGPGTRFKIKMRPKNSEEHNGKKYRYFTVLEVYDDMFLCIAEGNFRETFSAWEMCHRAELVESDCPGRMNGTDGKEGETADSAEVSIENSTHEL